MGDKLFLSFGAKFYCKFIISHVKLQNCYGNISCFSISAKMASRFKTVTIEEVQYGIKRSGRELKYAKEHN